jgi:molybdopterin-guanine dinucleotide biosynthesis protein A
MRQTNGIVLCGGNSRRMGTDKGLIPWKGERLVLKSLELLKSKCLNVSLISNNSDYQSLWDPVYPDLITNCGPAGGILTGLTYSKSEGNLVLACDMPFVSPDFLDYLLAQLTDEPDAVVPIVQGRIQPLCAWYRLRTAANFKLCVENGILKMTEILDRLKVKYLPVPAQGHPFTEDLFRNLNRPEDLEM